MVKWQVFRNIIIAGGTYELLGRNFEDVSMF